MSRTRWVPYVAAAAGACLVVKGSLIIASGNAVSETPMAVLYLAGLALGLAAAIGAGFRQRGLLPGLAVGGGGCVLLLAWIMGIGDTLKPVVGVVSDAEHVQVEVPIVMAGLALLLLALRARARDTRPTPTQERHPAGAP
jgi:hypothetical protein